MMPKPAQNKTNDNLSAKNPLAEVFGFDRDDQSATAQRHRSKRLCPFNNKVPNCTKDKAQNPLGVCSIFHNHNIAVTCPIRFHQDWLITDDAADFFFGENATWTTLTETRLKDANGNSAGNIDMVLCAYDENGKVYDFGALEIQAVYISGNIRTPFENYMKSTPPGINRKEESNPPHPDYLSSSRKRLAPQLMFKGEILNAWKKKIAVVVGKSFFETLPKLCEVQRKDADVAWLIYDVKQTEKQGVPNSLVRVNTVYTRFETAIKQITKPEIGEMEDFLRRLQDKVDEMLETPPVNKLLQEDEKEREEP
jgi:hypothetical protein